MSWIDFIADRIAQTSIGGQISLAILTLAGLGYLVTWLAEWPDRRAARQARRDTIIWTLLYLEALRKSIIDGLVETIEEEEVSEGLDVELIDEMMELELKGIPRKKLKILIINLIKNLREDKMNYKKVLSYYDDEFDNQEKMLSLGERLDIDLQDYNLSPEQIETLLEREENLRQQYSEFSE